MKQSLTNQAINTSLNCAEAGYGTVGICKRIINSKRATFSQKIRAGMILTKRYIGVL